MDLHDKNLVSCGKSKVEAFRFSVFDRHPKRAQFDDLVWGEQIKRVAEIFFYGRN